MKFKPVFLLAVIALFAFSGCEKSPEGPTKKMVDQLYKKRSFLCDMYTESMIRTATNVADIDSTFLLSGHTEYFLTFNADLKRYYRPETDSILHILIAKQGLELFGKYENKTNKTEVFVTSNNDWVQNVVVIQRDSSTYQVYEFVGEMPLSEMVNFAAKNYKNISNMNFLKSFNNAGIDSGNP